MPFVYKKVDYVPFVYKQVDYDKDKDFFHVICWNKLNKSLLILEVQFEASMIFYFYITWVEFTIC